MKRERWNERYAEREFLWGVEPNRLFTAEVRDLLPGRALDVACGEGRNAAWLAEQGWQVTAVDFSEVAIERARRIAAHRGVDVDYVAADVLSFEPPPAPFDLVAVLYLQLPAAERRRALRIAARAVASGGTLLVLAHDERNLTEGHGGPQDASVLYGPDDVVGDIAGLGLEVERAERTLRDVEGADRPAIDAFVRASRPSA